ncbi:MAG: methyl-accepting chemotaxis protein, partial [Spirochaetes bacterium]|nr:methyl-accepting chemotaxis protein [Spirochaetota bacterium]
MKLTIKQRLNLLGIIVTLIILILIGFFLYILNSYGQMNQISNNFTEIYKHVLEINKDEKDFILTKKSGPVDRIRMNKIYIRDKIKELTLQIKDEEILTLLNEVNENNKLYLESFNQIFDLYSKRGMSEHQGLRGELRDEIREVEKIIEEQANTALLNRLLILRKWEKNYFIRLDDTYVEKFNADINPVIESVSGSDIAEDLKVQLAELVKQYQSTFNEISQLDNDIKLHNDELYKLGIALREDIKKLDTDMNNNITKTLNIIKLVVPISSGVFIIITLLFLFFTIISITRPMYRIIKFIHALTQGDFTQRIARKKDDEIGNLSLKLNDFVLSLCNIVTDIKRLSDNSINVSERLASASEETSTALEEIRVNVESMKDKTSNLNEEINRANQSSEQVNKYTDNVLN